ncbi:MAG: ACT domain-containing protein, partial [Mangrovicoccus sp.]|nr:ACT domain-containing protein [Mangrovicoccus sp.]
MSQYTLTVQCASKPGVVAGIATYLANAGCNITDAQQFDDSETGKFFMRLNFESLEGTGIDALKEGFAPLAENLALDQYAFHDPSEKMKVIIMVSRFGHCLNDL